MYRMANSVDTDETAHYEPSHLDLNCLQKYFLDCRAEKIKAFTVKPYTILIPIKPPPPPPPLKMNAPSYFSSRKTLLNTRKGHQNILFLATDWTQYRHFSSNVLQCSPPSWGIYWNKYGILHFVLYDRGLHCL